MSDLDVARALDALAELLHSKPLKAEDLRAWRQRYDAAMATAERGKDWSAIEIRIHELPGKLDAAAETLSVEQESLRKQMLLQAQGARALKGYRPF
jgi:hypothetical protein